MFSLSRFLNRFRSRTARRRPLTRCSDALRFRPAFDVLEERTVPSTVSSIVGNFNGSAIPAGDTVWFNSAFTASGLPKTGAVTIHVDNGAIDFSANGTPYHVAVPNGVIVLTPGATSAAASFDPNDNDWDVSAPTGGAGNVFMGGVAMPVTSSIPGGIKNVTWSASFWSDTAGVTVNWRWSAAVYQSFSTDNNALGVKPVDNNSLSAYKNGDHAGTPEAYKSFDTAGALGGGGNNYTGNLTGATAVKPTLGDGASTYPYVSSNPLTSVAFNESTVVKAANLDLVNGTFEVWYSDEHALALGVRQVNVKTASGTTTTNYDLTALTANPGVATNAAVGTTATTGDQAGTDLSGRLVAPSLYITDTTNDPKSQSGDWQFGGTALPPGAVFGTWKGAVRTVDYTTGTPTVTVTCDVDPVKNLWNLGAGSDAPPAGTANEGYGAEVRWSLADLQNQGVLIPGHTYRFYVIVHDGDQNKSGGDCGQASFNYTFPGVITPQTASISGQVQDFTGGVSVGGILITLTNTSTLQTWTMYTNPDGTYSFANLPAGNYTVSIDTSTVPPGDLTQGSAGMVSGTTTVDGTNGATSITAITLNVGDAGINYNFSIFGTGG
jgi:hypothetical protein